MPEPKLKEKRWDKEFETSVYESWKKSEAYKFNKTSKKQIYSIDTPPPYINTPVHIGQATTYVLMDMFARFRRMLDYEVLFPLGLDKNGIPIEVAAEKKFNIKLNETPRELFINYCEKLLKESGLATIDSFLRLGISFNSWKLGTGIGEIYETDSEDYRALTQETFIDLYKAGLIYEGSYITNYSPQLRTTIADAEIIYEDIPTYFNDVIFKVKETNEEIIIGTTRPELICTCAMVIFNPKDERYKYLEGKTAITPLYKKEIPIKAHPQADMEKGTGLVMMCSMGDLSDIRFFREQKLKPIIAINEDGLMNEHSGFLKDLTVGLAREKMIEELKKHSLLVKQTKTLHRTPIAERSNSPVEFIETKEFYLKQVPFKKEMKELAKKANFYDKSSKKILLDWIDSITTDWPISRRRYYATEIPLWYCKNCNQAILPNKGSYYQPWKQKCPVKKCPKCSSTEFVGEKRVFDTWFDSSISPLYILKYSRDSSFFKKAFPCSLRPQGKEIIRTWYHYTVLKDYLLTKKLIFKDVWINYHIVDEKGHKMSKSKGNVIDPKDVLAKFGAEPFRLWSAIEGNLAKTDFRCSYERIDGTTKTLTKLWNIARFISMFKEAKKPKLKALDKWILNELNDLIKYSKEHYLEYDFHSPSTKIKHFIWETFASHYLELAKSRAYKNDASARFTLHYSLNIILKLLAPITPFITYKIYKTLNNKDIHQEPFPSYQKSSKFSFSAKEIEELNSLIWKAKQEKNLSLKDPIKKLSINKKFKEIADDIIKLHNVQELEFSSKFHVEL